jgi:cytochrome c peroxidase
LGLYGADGRSVSVGHKGQTGARNANSSLNADFQLAQFWDGRAKNLEEQALGPLVNPLEMANDSNEDVVGTLRSIPGYVQLFKEAFPQDAQPVTIQNAVRAIAAFERTLITPSRFDVFLKGDTKALNAKEREGLALFLDKGCNTCHNGVGVGGGMFQKFGIVKPNPNAQDLGRYAVTKNEADRYIFKVPILRNVAETAPYFHDGSVWGLQEAIKTMAELQLGLKLNKGEVEKISAFLGSLTGELPEEALILPVFPRSGKETPRPRS